MWQIPVNWQSPENWPPLGYRTSVEVVAGNSVEKLPNLLHWHVTLWLTRSSASKAMKGEKS